MIDGLSISVSSDEGDLALTYVKEPPAIHLTFSDSQAAAVIGFDDVERIYEFLSLVLSKVRSDAAPSPSTDWEIRMAAIKEAHPKAYEPWTEEEDALLWGGHLSGMTNAELAKRLERQPSAVRSRVKRLGQKHENNSSSEAVIEEDTD